MPPVPNSPYGRCGREARFEEEGEKEEDRDSRARESRGGRSGPYGLCGRKARFEEEEEEETAELRSCVKVEVDVLGSPSLIVLTVSVDVK